MRLGALALITMAACGRVGFVPGAPGATDANTSTDATGANDTGDSSGAAMPMLIASASDFITDQLVLTLDTTPIDADLLVVAITVWDSAPVQQVTDSTGGALTRAAHADVGGLQSELWYESPAPASTDVVVTLTATSSGFDVWAGSFDGVAIGAPAMTATNCLAYPPDLVVVPVDTTVPGELVLDVTMFQNPVYVDAVDPPFATMGPFATGNGAVYYVAPTPGSYAPTWHIGSGSGAAAMTCGCSASFMPSP